MKRLRNIGIYYTLFGILLMVSFIFTNLWRISLLGIALLLIYFILKVGFKKNKIETKLSGLKLILWDLFLILFPFIYVLLTCWYVWRPYKQTIVIPKDYEGVVAIQYNKPDGQEKRWIGGFLGIGASRLIKVDTTGIAKTQFGFHHNAIPFLGAKQTYYNRGGLKIYYENDFKNEIIKGANGKSYTYEDKDENKPNIYFTGFRKYPLVIFVVTKSENYLNYFMTKEEKKIEQRAYDNNPYENYPPDEHELNKRYSNKFYGLNPHYRKK
ncbi:MAG: hypothetical protein AAF600_07360 [Bacteroidota bacterium]